MCFNVLKQVSIFFSCLGESNAVKLQKHLKDYKTNPDFHQHVDNEWIYISGKTVSKKSETNIFEAVSFFCTK